MFSKLFGGKKRAAPQDNKPKDNTVNNSKTEISSKNNNSSKAETTSSTTTSEKLAEENRDKKIAALEFLTKLTNDKNTNKVIPGIVNLIWFGSWPPQYTDQWGTHDWLSTLEQWRKLNPNFQINLWTAGDTMPAEQLTEMKDFCHDNHLNLKDISELKPNEHSALNENNYLKACRDWLNAEKIGKPRFAAASDLLRKYLLLTQGGHYADLDIEPQRSYEKINWACDRGSYQLINLREYLSEGDDYSFKYCVMGAVPNDELYQVACKKYLEAHPFIMQALNEAVTANKDVDWTDFVIKMTGTHLTSAAQSLKKVPALVPNEGFSIDSGPLKHALSINFSRSYGREDKHKKDTQSVIEPVFKKIQQAYGLVEEKRVEEKNSTKLSNSNVFTAKNNSQKKIIPFEKNWPGSGNYGGIRTLLGATLVSRFPIAGGISEDKAKKKEGLPFIELNKSGMSIYFVEAQKNYSKDLYAYLKNENLFKSNVSRVDGVPLTTQHGTYTSVMMIDDHQDVARLIQQICGYPYGAVLDLYKAVGLPAPSDATLSNVKKFT